MYLATRGVFFALAVWLEIRFHVHLCGTRKERVVTGGHPGDPECGCGGTIARYTALGHDAALLYLNHGQGRRRESRMAGVGDGVFLVLDNCPFIVVHRMTGKVLWETGFAVPRRSSHTNHAENES